MAASSLGPVTGTVDVDTTATSVAVVPGTRRRTPYERMVKRPLDLVGSILLLVVLAPLMSMVALGVLVTMGTPILYRQERVGLDGRIFTMLKFRSMRTEQWWRAQGLGPIPVHAPDDDPRHTSFGRFIRKFSLDELPQLFNVVVGDMSLIGPRPEIVSVAIEHDLVNHPRHLVRPGMTGPWQVSEFRSSYVHMHVHIDAEYVGDLSLRRDTQIALKTLRKVVSG